MHSTTGVEELVIRLENASNCHLNCLQIFGSRLAWPKGPGLELACLDASPCTARLRWVVDITWRVYSVRKKHKWPGVFQPRIRLLRPIGVFSATCVILPKSPFARAPWLSAVSQTYAQPLCLPLRHFMTCLTQSGPFAFFTVLKG